jgi:hypothetical protein
MPAVVHLCFVGNIDDTKNVTATYLPAIAGDCFAVGSVLAAVVLLLWPLGW